VIAKILESCTTVVSIGRTLALITADCANGERNTICSDSNDRSGSRSAATHPDRRTMKDEKHRPGGTPQRRRTIQKRTQPDFEQAIKAGPAEAGIAR